ncbi:hypothetical protein [Citrobacter portucalensis]|uniref:hypothetical protein n=1 Tax=Citrobacter portucalensis TaxID=1639133 RepID=UPI003904A100
MAELARKATYKPCAMHMTNLLAVCDSEVIEEMARQLLASMEQEPVAYMHHSGQVVTREECCDDEIFAICCKVETPLYAAPQLPQPAVPDMAAVGEMPFLGTQEKAFVSGWNACRAAMLQGAEPASNCDELPLDYLQGHKDGLEWAAQLAEANHPQTGDWLYDDPIELARAIRKGPDIPEFKSVSVDEDDNFYSWFGRFWYENYQKNNYTTSAKQMLGTMAEFAYRAGRESAALAANSPLTPDGWQLVPKEPTEAMNKAGWAAINEHDAINPTYRAMLAAAPQQDVRLALEIGMSRYAGAMQKLVDSGD